MSGLVLDTSVLATWWRRKGGQGPLDRMPRRVDKWARELIRIRGADRIVSPVYLEFVCGMNSATRLSYAEQFLDQFQVLDDWHIADADWSEARRIARRIPSDGRPRQLVDCLIRAVSNRFRCEVDTLDHGFPR